MCTCGDHAIGVEQSIKAVDVELRSALVSELVLLATAEEAWEHELEMVLAGVRVSADLYGDMERSLPDVIAALAELTGRLIALKATEPRRR